MILLARFDCMALGNSLTGIDREQCRSAATVFERMIRPALGVQMVLRCILIPTASGVDVTPRLDAALKLGRRLGAHVRVLFISPEPHHFLETLPDVVRAAGVTVDRLNHEVTAAAAIGKAALDAWCVRMDVRREDTGDRLDAVFATWTEDIGELEELVALAGRVSDLTVVDRPNSDLQFTERAFDSAVFSTGRPVLMIPEDVPDDLLNHVVIAWNGSLEAARVVGQSIELLHGARRVSIIQVDASRSRQVQPADLSAYLRWHGIITHPLRIVELGHATLGDAILAEALKNDATLLVMGAYTHSRIRQFLLGGVTKHVLDHATIPVLMAH